MMAPPGEPRPIVSSSGLFMFQDDELFVMLTREDNSSLEAYPRADVKQELYGHLNPGCMRSGGGYEERDNVWWEAQSIHFGLRRSKNIARVKSEFKKIFKKNSHGAHNGYIEVPPHILDIEQGLRNRYDAAWERYDAEVTRDQRSGLRHRENDDRPATIENYSECQLHRGEDSPTPEMKLEVTESEVVQRLVQLHRQRMKSKNAGWYNELRSSEQRYTSGAPVNGPYSTVDKDSDATVDEYSDATVDSDATIDSPSSNLGRTQLDRAATRSESSRDQKGKARADNNQSNSYNQGFITASADSMLHHAAPIPLFPEEKKKMKREWDEAHPLEETVKPIKRHENGHGTPTTSKRSRTMGTPASESRPKKKSKRLQTPKTPLPKPQRRSRAPLESTRTAGTPTSASGRQSKSKQPQPPQKPPSTAQTQEHSGSSLVGTFKIGQPAATADPQLDESNPTQRNPPQQTRSRRPSRKVQDSLSPTVPTLTATATRKRTRTATPIPSSAYNTPALPTETSTAFPGASQTLAADDDWFSPVHANETTIFNATCPSIPGMSWVSFPTREGKKYWVLQRPLSFAPWNPPATPQPGQSMEMMMMMMAPQETSPPFPFPTRDEKPSQQPKRHKGKKS
ncbi:hypothetical protein EJ08DRAFT_172660 [Tothia fuscella]|uniref:Uncharacterized protein n=1 Tax=Tothia fuscella TaxID=1048955 RepID=A0A9P4NU29_9PEZI|nr:hypothetical protein EJ08DRAFT_172660 [Tothia fuscella]